MMNRRWTNKEDNTLKLRYENGDSTSEIATQLNRSVSAIHNRAHKLGVRHPAAGHRWTDQESKMIINLKSQGKTQIEVAKIMDVKPDSIQSFLNNRNLTRQFVPQFLETANQTEIDGVSYLVSIGKQNVKRTHESIVAPTPADITYKEENNIVGVNVKSGADQVIIVDTNLSRMIKKYNCVEYLWKYQDSWFLFRLTNWSPDLS